MQTLLKHKVWDIDAMRPNTISLSRGELQIILMRDLGYAYAYGNFYKHLKNHSENAKL